MILNLLLNPKVRMRNAIIRKVSTKRHKVRINIAIKRFKNYINFIFFLSKPHHFLLFFHDKSNDMFNVVQ